jgi:hypothetical protein
MQIPAKTGVIVKLRNAILNKKGEEIIPESIVRIALFIISLLFVIILVVTACAKFMSNSASDNAPQQALNDVYNAARHFDPEFGKLTEVLTVKTNEYKIYGFNYKEMDYCMEEGKSCICLCLNPACDKNKLPYEKICKFVDYPVSDSFEIESKDGYKKIEVYLVKTEGGYVLHAK